MPPPPLPPPLPPPYSPSGTHSLGRTLISSRNADILPYSPPSFSLPLTPSPVSLSVTK